MSELPAMIEYGIRGPDGDVHRIGCDWWARELAELSRDRPGWSVMSRVVFEWTEVPPWEGEADDDGEPAMVIDAEGIAHPNPNAAD